jgi:hypothetical protein
MSTTQILELAEAELAADIERYAAASNAELSAA